MVRTYRRKTDRGKYGERNLSAAIEAVKKGTPLIRASKEYGVPARTLRRHRDGKVVEPGLLKFGRYRNALPLEIELQLKEHVLDMQRRLHGLRMLDMRRLAYDLAEKAGIKHPFNNETKKAGTDWVQNFLQRHNLSIRQPQGTSVARAVAFNRPQVKRFFDLYKEVLEQFQGCTPSRVWNVDETGLTTVQSPGKVIASKGTKQVGKITSAERGVLVTVICACSAAGLFLPPMYIFPRKRMVNTLMKDAPPQAIGYANPSGWSDAELFLKWLQHFAGYVNCSRENRHIILLDGHHSHKTLQAIEFCRDNGIELITLPPHSTHRMQPLDRTYFKALKSAFNAEADSWMVTNPGRRITIHDMASLTGKAFLRTALPERAVQGFKTCGLWPFDPNVFTDVDFEAALMTEEEMEANNPGQLPSERANTSAQPAESTAVQSETCSTDSEANNARQPPQNSASTPARPAETTLMHPETCSTDSDANQWAPEDRCDQEPPSSSPNCNRFEARDVEVIQTSSDGRCLFRSLVIAMDPKLQRAERDEHGVLTNPVLNMNEKSQVDGLRAKVIEYMCNNYDEFKDLDVETINADLPNWLSYSSMEDRIAAMANPLSLPGELEVDATSKILKRQIVILNNDNMVLQRYGTDTRTNFLMVQFTSVGQDVGHYNCVLHIRAETDRPTPTRDQQKQSSSTSTSAPPGVQLNPQPSTSSHGEHPNPQPSTSTSAPCQIRQMIQGIFPLPKIQTKRSRTRKPESAAVVTSSPYKASLIEKNTKQKSAKKTKQLKKRKKKGKGGKNKKGRQEEMTSDEEEDWPCLICCEPYSRARAREKWVQCQMCRHWAHEECTPGFSHFICPNCDSDSD